MKIIKTKLKDTFILEQTYYEDSRGYFSEIFRLSEFEKFTNISNNFVQENKSRSIKNVLRGLHFQLKFPQGKLVFVTCGKILDIIVDLRKNSETFGLWDKIILSDSNKRQLWIPEGIAHGFLVLSEYADFQYKCTEYYKPSDEFCLRWNEPKLSIDWPIKNPILSPKDQKGLSWDEIVNII